MLLLLLLFCDRVPRKWLRRYCDFWKKLTPLCGQIVRPRARGCVVVAPFSLQKWTFRVRGAHISGKNVKRKRHFFKKLTRLCCRLLGFSPCLQKGDFGIRLSDTPLLRFVWFLKNESIGDGFSYGTRWFLSQTRCVLSWGRFFLWLAWLDFL